MPAPSKTLRLYLASASPRRRQLLSAIAPQAVVVPSSFEEPPLPPALPRPVPYLKNLALQKARHAKLPKGARGWVLGADTIVLLGHTPLGKPKNRAEARRMLAALSGQEQRVFTAVAVLNLQTGGAFGAVERTRLWFRPLTPAQIERYLDTGEWTDKAGAYGGQGLGAALIERVSGCWSNVVGLPMAATLRLLKEAGCSQG